MELMGLKWRVFVIMVVWMGGVAHALTWPFDQRQVALIQMEAEEFPDLLAAAQIMDAFVKAGRVRWVTQKATKDQIVPILAPKDFQWQSEAAVRALGLRLKADGLVVLIRRGVLVDLRWYATVDGKPLFFESVSLPQAGDDKESAQRKERVQRFVESLWSRIPGQGFVVSRDMSALKVEGAKELGLKVGDVLELRRLLRLERHPVLKTLTTIPSSITGRAEITEIGELSALAKIVFESDLDPIQEGDRYQKVAAVPETVAPKPAAGMDSKSVGATQPAVDPKAGNGEGVRRNVPLFGAGSEEPSFWTKPVVGPEPEYKMLDVVVAPAFVKATHSDQLSVGTESVTRDLSDWGPGLVVLARGLLTPELALDAALAFSSHSFDPSDYEVSSASGLRSYLTRLRLGTAYRIQFTQEMGVPGELSLGLGYRQTQQTMGQISSDAAPTAKTLSGWEVFAQIQVPATERVYPWARLGRTLRTKVTESPAIAGGEAKASMLEFSAGLRFRLTHTSEVVFGYSSEQIGINYTGAGARSTPSLSTNASSSTLSLGYMYRL
jgi:hypothetical protein